MLTIYYLKSVIIIDPTVITSIQVFGIEELCCSQIVHSL